MPGKVRQRVGKAGAGSGKVPAPAFDDGKRRECFGAGLGWDVTEDGVWRAAVNRPHSRRFATLPPALEGARPLECACFSTALEAAANRTVIESDGALSRSAATRDFATLLAADAGAAAE